MNGAGKHIENSNINTVCRNNVLTSTAVTSPTQQKNIINSIMSFLPDNRPITSLQIVEECEKCPKNFWIVHRTYDQDSDADLWRENNILFGRQTTRYLCLSKSEGLPDYVVETLKVIAEKIQPPKEFSLLSRTADTEQKAWRKRQITYKLSKRSIVTRAVTDIILCSKLKIAPEGFQLAGDINGILVCYKIGTISTSLPPAVSGPKLPQFNYTNSGIKIEETLSRINLNGNNIRNLKLPLPPVPAAVHDYEEIKASYKFNSPSRPAVVTAIKISEYSVGTLGSYAELDGVPFAINPALKKFQNEDLPILQQRREIVSDMDYDFQLERQILCTMKSSASKNPFFK